MSAAAARHLRIVDGNGEVLEPSGPEEQVRALEQALVRSQRTIDGLRNQLADKRKQAKATYPIDEAFEDWKTKLVEAGLKGKARCKLSDDRVDAINAMFEAGYSLTDFKLVNTGIAACQYVVYGRRQQRGDARDQQVDISYVCEKARRFEEAARLGHIVNKSKEA
jgi:hypothetical protein